MRCLLLLCIFCVHSWAADTQTQLLLKTVKTKQSTWRAGVQSGLSVEDVKHRLGFMGLHPDPNYHVEVKTHKMGRLTIPETFDAREVWPECKDVINNIRNQGNCGSCWAFAVAEVMSDRFCIQSKGKDKIEFAPQDLISCCGNCGFGCNGGYTIQALYYFNERGVVSGGDYQTNKGCRPYESLAYLNNTTPSCKTTCTTPNYPTSFNEDKRYGDSQSYSLKSGDVQQIQMEILKNGPVVASYSVYEDFTLYESGVYYYTTGEKLGGHAVKIIGWGTENNVPYWLVANSWGADWALKGYFKIRRGTNECGFEERVVAGFGDLDKRYKAPNPKPDDDGSSGDRVVSGIGMVLAGLIFYISYL